MGADLSASLSGSSMTITHEFILDEGHPTGAFRVSSSTSGQTTEGLVRLDLQLTATPQRTYNPRIPTGVVAVLLAAIVARAANSVPYVPGIMIGGPGRLQGARA